MINPTPRATGLRARPGYSLVEFMIVVVILSVVGGAIMKMMHRQQQFYTGTSDLVELRSQLRQAAAVLASDFRGVSSSGGDINAMTSSSIDFYYTMGSSIACAVPSGSNITIPPVALTSGSTLTSLTSDPAPGDIVYAYDEGATLTSSSDDVWRSYTLQSASQAASACGTTPYTSAADASTPSWIMAMTSAVSGTIRQGAAIRIVRRAYYGLYQSSSDSRYYLGYCTPTCGTIAPVAGPFDAGGLNMTYYDSLGTVTTIPASVSRISILLQGQTRHLLRIPGLKQGAYTDSVRVNVALRNRS